MPSVASLILAIGGLAQVTTAEPTVTLSSGALVGTTSAIANSASPSSTANVFLGIPYAKTPPLRFSPPEPVQPWQSPMIAQSRKPACFQQFAGTEAEANKSKANFNNALGEPPAESEDCLYLNVFSPSNASNTALKPVFVWIYGGNLRIGSASNAQYDGSSIAINQDVVVVTFNYRTNVFGFSNSPEIAHGLQNSGFLDQRFALKWVQDNIEAFGGDPKQVTIGGQSAGGFSVKQLLAYPPDPIPFRAAILQSQQTNLSTKSDENWNVLSRHFNCGEGSASLQCMRQVNGSDIKAFIEKETLVFSPREDNLTFTRDVRESLACGRFAPVPVLIGTNGDDASYQLYNNAVPKTNATIPGEVVVKYIASQGVPQAAARQLLSAIEVAYGVDAIDWDVLDRLATDLIFTCETSTLSAAIAGAKRQPVWRYRYDAGFPNTELFPGAGSWHSSEIWETFGTYPRSDKYGNATRNQVQLSKFMQATWMNFVKDPTKRLPWSRLGDNHTAGTSLGLIGSQLRPVGVEPVPLHVADAACPVLNKVLSAAGLGY